jgi:GxxExxY protein
LGQHDSHIRQAKIDRNENPRDWRTEAIIGAAMEVHRILGYGFLESVYQQALGKEFALRKIPFCKEVDLSLEYKGESLDASYRVDFICYGGILVELKALTQLSGTEEGQIINYLKASKKNLALLINFGRPSLSFKRLIWSERRGDSDDEISTIPLA